MSSRFPAPARCPDISTCRASHSGMGNLAYCLNEGRLACDYPLSFGGKFFCNHPQRMEIVAFSNALKKPQV